MGIESFGHSKESGKHFEVRRFLPAIVEQIRSAVEDDTVFTPSIKKMIFVALEITPEEAVSEMLDHSRRYRGAQDTKKDLRQLLADRIMEGVEGEMKGGVDEQSALLVFLRDKVLNVPSQP